MTVCLTVPKILVMIAPAAMFVGRHAAAVVIQRTVGAAVDRRLEVRRRWTD